MLIIELIKQGKSAPEIIYTLVVYFIAMTLAFSFHEFMHAAAATWCGDDTARNQGRLTLNPLSHIDPIGTLCILLVGFGWGKPVPYNPNYLNRFKSKKLMRIIVTLAGVFGNFLLALVFNEINVFAFIFASKAAWYGPLSDVCDYTGMISLMLMAFNLIPIPPLDGFHVLEEFISVKTKCSDGYRTFITKGPQILWIVILVSNFTGIRIFNYVIEIIELPARSVIALVSLITYSIFL